MNTSQANQEKSLKKVIHNIIIRKVRKGAGI